MTLLGVDKPIALAPMGMVAGGALAAAVSEAGGLSERWHGREAKLLGSLIEEQRRYAAAAEQRDYDTAVIFAGVAVDLIDSVLPAREVVRRICGA